MVACLVKKYIICILKNITWSNYLYKEVNRMSFSFQLGFPCLTILREFGCPIKKTEEEKEKKLSIKKYTLKIDLCTLDTFASKYLYTAAIDVYFYILL